MINCRRLCPGVEAVRRYPDVQATLCPLISLGTAVVHCPSPKLLAQLLFQACWTANLWPKGFVPLDPFCCRDGFKAIGEYGDCPLSIVWPKNVLGNPFYEGNHYLCLRKPNQPQTRLVTGNPDKDMFLDEFFWVSGSWEFRAGDDGPWSFSRYNGRLPDKFNNRFKRHSDRCKEAIRAANNKQDSRDIDVLLAYEPYYQHKICHSSPNPLDNKEEESDDAASRLVLNKRQDRVVSVVKPVDAALPISVSRSDDEHSDVLKVAPAANPNPSIATALHVPPKAIDLVVGLAKTIMGVSSSPLEASLSGKLKGKELLARLPKKPQLKIGETGSIAATELWKSEFSAFELGRQVTVADSIQDHDTSVALARAVMLPNDVATLSEEDNETMRSLLVMQHVQLSSVLLVCKASKEQWRPQIAWLSISTEWKRAKKKTSSLESELEKIEDRHPRRFYGCVSSPNSSSSRPVKPYLQIRNSCTYLYQDDSVPFVSWLSARHDALTVPPLDRLLLGMCFYAPTVIYLLSPDIPQDGYRPLPLAQASGAVVVPSSLDNGISGVTKALAWAAFILVVSAPNSDAGLRRSLLIATARRRSLP
ncbi:hypothetical protein Acr_02g0012190 [Actinidia rufa]|uniref:Uncharacterized protein n=1 Tax=Actinidia rufa TaxID=165716 RepID=A0A7J0EAM1_9ERIC|nr:hypothetical protein Acr_02g0012190 [Actinidia rufa]